MDGPTCGPPVLEEVDPPPPTLQNRVVAELPRSVHARSTGPIAVRVGKAVEVKANSPGFKLLEAQKEEKNAGLQRRSILRQAVGRPLFSPASRYFLRQRLEKNLVSLCFVVFCAYIRFFSC